MNNKQTSKRVASVAGTVLPMIRTYIQRLEETVVFLKAIESVVGSALTQAPDKVKKRGRRKS